MDTTKQNQIILDRLNQALKKVIDHQIYDNDPPETAETLERLIDSGYTIDQAYNLIGLVVSQHFHNILETEAQFNQEQYIKDLEQLPAPFTGNNH